MKTLLLERDVRHREPLARMLRARGHQVYEHTHWDGAAAELAHHPLHLAFIDWTPDAARWIDRSRHHANGARMLVVALLSREQLDDLERIFQSGANDYLLRPLDDPAHEYRVIQFEYRLHGWARILETHGKSTSDHLRAAVEHSGDIVEITDADMHYLYVNPAYTRVFGFTFTEVLGRQPAEFLRSGRHTLSFYRDIERIVDAGGVWRGELTSRTKGGRLVYLDATIIGVTNDAGQVIRQVAVKRDITARRQAEEAVRQAKAHLQATISSLPEAVLSLDRESVILLANPAAQAIASVLDEPMVGRRIDEVLHLLDEDDERRILDPISQLLDPDTGDIRVHRFAAVDAMGQAHPVHPSVTPLLDEYGDRLGAVLVLRDMKQTRRVEEVLAAKTMAEAANHSKSVFLATVSHDLRTPMNGVLGAASLLARTELDEEQRDLLDTLSRSSNHLLELIDELLEAARDELVLDTGGEPGADDARPAPMNARRSREERPAAPAEPRVLLVDDNAINRKVARRMLERMGIACQEAKDGYEAVDLSVDHVHDAVLMDCHMPGMSGLEATRLIRDHESHTGQRRPIIALTADGAYHDRKRCLSAGMDDYLSKPLRLTELESMLRAWNVLPPAHES